MKVTEVVTRFAQPIVEEKGCTLWDVEYVREGSERFLRLYIDKEGGVSIDDCEAVSRELDVILDEVDPIPESYVFEVSSAGAERALKRPSDFVRYLNSPVLLKLYRAKDGRKEFAGHLAAYDEATGDITITLGKETLTFTKKEVALIRLRVEF